MREHEMTPREHMRHHKTTYLSLALLIVILVAWGAGVLVVRQVVGRGTIEIRDLPAGATVYVNERVVEIIESGISTVSTDLSPREHSVLIAYPNAFTWLKEITILRDETTTVTPFNIPTNVPASILSSIDSRYRDVRNLFTIAGPTETRSRLSDDESIVLWIDGRALRARWLGEDEDIPEFFCLETCETEIIVTEPIVPLENADFFPGRRDVAIIAGQTGVFAIEFDRRGTQNFQPIYPEHNATFRIAEEGTVYVKDGGAFYEMDI